MKLGGRSSVMRICFLNQAPKKSAAYEAARIEAQLNSYASPGTKVEIVFPDDYEGSQLYDTIGSQSILNGLHHMLPNLFSQMIGN